MSKWAEVNTEGRLLLSALATWFWSFLIQISVLWLVLVGIVVLLSSNWSRWPQFVEFLTSITTL